MAERQNSSISNDDVDLDNEFEFDPSDWMVLDDDEDDIDDSLLEEEKSCDTSHSVNEISQSDNKKVADAAVKTQHKEDSSSVRTTRSNSSNISSATRKKKDELKSEKLESPEVTRKGRSAVKDAKKGNGNSGKTSDVKKSVPQNVSSPVKSTFVSPSQSNKKLPASKGADTTVSTPGPQNLSSPVKSTSVSPSQSIKKLPASKGADTTFSAPGPQNLSSPVKSTSVSQSNKKLPASKGADTTVSAPGPQNVSSPVNSTSVSPSQSNKKLPASKGADITVSAPGSNKDEATRSRQGISKEAIVAESKSAKLSQSTGVVSARKGSTPKPATDDKSNAAVKRKNDDNLKTSLSSVPTKMAKNNTPTISQNKCVMKDESKGVAKGSPKNNVAATASSKVGSEFNSLSSKAGNNITQAGSVKVSLHQGTLSTRASKDSSPKGKGGDVKSTTSSNDLKRQNSSAPQTSKRSLPSTENKSGEKKDDAKGVTNSQGVEGSIAEAMGVVVSENEVSSSINDEDVLWDRTRLVSTSKADIARREQLANRKTSGESNKSPKPESKTTVAANQNSTKEGSKPRNSDGISNSDSATPPVTKKRIVRRFHRTTQTLLVPQVSNKMLQCLIKIPALDSPKECTHDVGLQTENKDNSLVHFSSDVVSVKPDTVSQDAFQEAINFGMEEAVTIKSNRANRKYGLRLCRLSSSDVEKAGFFLKKADSYNISFISKDCGFLDLFFDDEDNYIHIINVLRKVRFGPRYLCATVVRPWEEREKKGKDSDVPHLTATILFDQNFLQSGYLVRNKSPAWSKPKPEVYVSVHNVPDGIPLSFLKFIFPDAISVEMDDPKLTFTNGVSRVKLGLSRKVIVNFLKLFSQVLVNNTPVILTSGLTREEDISEMKEIIQERNTRKEQLKVSSSTLSAVARDINSNTKQTKVDEKPDIIMMVDGERSVDKILIGRSSIWNGPSSPERLHQHINKVQSRQSRASLPNQDSGELSDISDNSDFGEEVPKVEDVIDLTDSPDMLNKWRQTEPFSIMNRRQHPKDYPRGRDSTGDNSIKVGSQPADIGRRDNRIGDRSFDRDRTPPREGRRDETREGRRDENIRPDHRRKEDVMTGRHRGFDPHGGGRRGSEGPCIEDRDSQKSGNRGLDQNNTQKPSTGRPDKKWPDLNDADFDKSHKVLLPQVPGSRRRGSNEGGDLRSMLEDLKSQRHRSGDNRSRDRRSMEFGQRSSSPSGLHRSREFQRRNERSRSPAPHPDRDRRVVRKSLSPVRRHSARSWSRSRSPPGPPRKAGITAKDLQKKFDKDSIIIVPEKDPAKDQSSSQSGSREFQRRVFQRRNERSRSPAHPDRDRRVVRKSLSPVRRRSVRSRSRSPAAPHRKPGVTAKDLEKKFEKEYLISEKTQEWKSKWELEELELSVSEKDPAKDRVNKSNEEIAEEISLGKTLFNKLMGHLKEKAEVCGPSEDGSVMEAANVYNQINNLAEQLTAIKNEVNTPKPSREKPKSPPPTTASYSQRVKEASQNLLNYYKPLKSSVSSSTAAQAPLPSSQVDKQSGALHPDLLRYVNAGAGNKSASPPPIPPPVAPPLFTSTSPTDKKAQLEAIAKQLATEILSDTHPEPHTVVTGGSWIVPPSQGVNNNVPSVSGVNVNPGIAPANLAAPPAQPMIFCSPAHSMGPGISSMNPGLMQTPPLFSMPHMVQMASTQMMNPLASSPLMAPPNRMPPNMWTPQPQFMPHGNNNPRF